MEENYLCYYVKKSIHYCQFLHEAGWSAVELRLTLAKVAAREWLSSKIIVRFTCSPIEAEVSLAFMLYTWRV
ncbi:hypothetical protein LOK49_LG01G01116 [Camellia lanceoleosa]|uniref:Uncharacterized protein n=1 Tax=Camellia lanceoleosa TaxID=1840588 RepID=A0ACC0IX68_9ERIC|nr:hypothetical protein LOK49_LG01G01116 [Camellia lanceoleosa]